MADDEKSFLNQGDVSSPLLAGAAITPSDAIPLTVPTRAIWVGTGGDLRVMLWEGDIITLPAVPAGALLPIRAKQVYATSTTATNLLALW